MLLPLWLVCTLMLFWSNADALLIFSPYIVCFNAPYKYSMSSLATDSTYEITRKKSFTPSIPSSQDVHFNSLPTTPSESSLNSSPYPHMIKISEMRESVSCVVMTYFICSNWWRVGGHMTKPGDSMTMHLTVFHHDRCSEKEGWVQGGASSKAWWMVTQCVNVKQKSDPPDNILPHQVWWLCSPENWKTILLRRSEHTAQMSLPACGYRRNRR